MATTPSSADRLLARAVAFVTLIVASCAVVGMATWIILSRTALSDQLLRMIQIGAALAGTAGISARASQPTIFKQILAAMTACVVSSGLFIVVRHLCLAPREFIIPKLGVGILPILFVLSLGTARAALVGCSVGLVWSVLLRLVNAHGRSSLR